MKKRIISATPLICLFIYLLIGFVWDIWHPTWVIFFLVVLVPIVLRDNFLRNMYPLLCVIVYIIIGVVFNWWHPGWIIFLTIPIYNILFEPYKVRSKEVKEIDEE